MSSVGNNATGSEKKMDFLGHSSSPFKRGRNRKWERVDVYCPNQESFCDLTSKIISGMKEECRFIIADDEGERHFIDVLDVRYDSTQNMIKLFPENIRKVKRIKKS
jgi:hypothetical protein